MGIKVKCAISNGTLSCVINFAVQVRGGHSQTHGRAVESLGYRAITLSGGCQLLPPGIALSINQRKTIRLNDLALRISVQLERVGTRYTFSFSFDKLVLSSEHRIRDIKAVPKSHRIPHYLVK